MTINTSQASFEAGNLDSMATTMRFDMSNFKIGMALVRIYFACMYAAKVRSRDKIDPNHQGHSASTMDDALSSLVPVEIRVRTTYLKTARAAKLRTKGSLEMESRMQKLIQLKNSRAGIDSDGVKSLRWIYV